MWGYSSFHAIARGVVTPKDDNKILLFVTEEKPSHAEPYADRLRGQHLDWEGPTDHFAEDRMVNATDSGDEIHLFHRQKHREGFVYMGQLRLIDFSPETQRPSRFTLEKA